MRRAFPGYYVKRTEEQFTNLWEQGTFVFDTNMLLNFFRYSEQTRLELYTILSASSVAGRLWIPHRVALEYHRNLHAVRYEQLSACHELKRTLESSRQKLRADDHQRRLAGLVGAVDGYIREEERRFSSDTELAWVERIADLFDGKVGARFGDKELKALGEEGEARYRKGIPPGFRDKDKKDGDDRIGDLIIWKEILAFAKQRTPTPLLFVTDDAKDDWWLRQGGKTQGPHPLLVDEVARAAPEVFFHMYPGDEFLKHARQYLRAKVTDDAVNEIKTVSEQRRNREALSRRFAMRDITAMDAHVEAGVREWRQRRHAELAAQTRYEANRVFLDLHECAHGWVTDLPDALEASFAAVVLRVCAYAEVSAEEYGRTWILENTSQGGLLNAEFDSPLTLAAMGVRAGAVLRLRWLDEQKTLRPVRPGIA